MTEFYYVSGKINPMFKHNFWISRNKQFSRLGFDNWYDITFEEI